MRILEDASLGIISSRKSSLISSTPGLGRCLCVLVPVELLKSASSSPVRARGTLQVLSGCGMNEEVREQTEEVGTGLQEQSRGLLVKTGTKG